MRRVATTVLGAAFLVALSWASPARANLLDDGSFELATDGTDTSNSAWSLTANIPGEPNGDTALAATFSTSVWAASDGANGVWFKSFEGEQAAGDDKAQAALTQTVSNVAGGNYTLSFQSARETFFTAGAMTASLSSSGGLTDTIDLLTAAYNDDGNMDSDPTTFSLSLAGVSAGEDLTVTVAMVDGVDALENPQSLMVDNFNLVPEPNSMILVGMSLIGLFSTRRRR